MRYVVEVKPLPGYHIHVRFDDGVEAELDLSEELWGEVFEPLKDEAEFYKVFVSDYGAVSWPNGADWDPDSMYEQAVAARAAVARN